MRPALHFDDADIDWILRLILLTQALAKRTKTSLPPQVSEFEQVLRDWLDSRADGHVNATTRPRSSLMGDDADELIDTTEAAEMLGITPGAVAKRCRSGSFIARKDGRDWMIPRADVEAERERA